MHVLFVHRNFPAQFGHIAARLVRDYGDRCTYVSELPAANVGGIERLQYQLQGGATSSTHYCSRTFENAVWHAHAVYEALRRRPDVQPDVVVGHSGFGSTVFLADLYKCPIINYFEYFYRGHDSDMDFRPDFPAAELDVLRARTRNAMILVDLETCTAGYAPTHWQLSLFPAAYQHKLTAIFDGVDTNLWQRRPVARRIGDRVVGDKTRIVTYVSRGFEAMRGFDIFMRTAKRIYQERPDVLFVCVGGEQICYGGDLKHVRTKTFKEHVLAQDTYDLEKFLFLGRVPPEQLAEVFSISDLHIYLTVPFVLSWSLMNALSCGCTVLASDTPPVREMIEPGVNGLVAGFFDVEGLAQTAISVLDDPPAFRHLGATATRIIRDNYSIDATLPKFRRLLEGAGRKDEG
jgi:glycosyltransferase involved in cell wall biosynthesis